MQVHKRQSNRCAYPDVSWEANAIVRLPATPTASAFAEGARGSAAVSLCDFIRGHAVTHSSTFPPENIFTACWALLSRIPPPEVILPVHQLLSPTVVKRPLRIGARLARRLPEIHFEGPC